MSEFSIVTYGGGEVLRHTFNGIVMVLSFGAGGFGSSLLNVIGVVGVVWTMALGYHRATFQPGLSWFGWYLLATTVLLTPKTTLYIKDPVSMNNVPYRVDNVPFVLGALAGTINEMMQGLTKNMESVFSLPDYLPYHQTGSIFASRLMAKTKDFKVVDPVFNRNLEKFVQQCVVYDTMMGNGYTKRDLETTNDLWGLVSRSPSDILGFYYQDDDQNEIVTCKQGAALLKHQWNAQIQLAAKYYGKQFFPHKQEDSAKQALLSKLPVSYQLLTGIAQNASKIIQQEMMANAIRDASRNKNVELGHSFALAKSSIQQQSFMTIAGELAAETLPLLKTVFECIAYGAFVFIFILAPLPGGHRILGNYFREILWIQSWPILYAVLNLMCTVWAQYRTGAAMGAQELTLINNVAISEANEGMKAIAGWLSLSVPFLSRIIVSGSLEGFVHMASYLSSTLQSSASQVAHETSSGNISMGNMSYNNSNMQSLSAFKLDRNGSYYSGQFATNMSDGAIKYTNAANQVYTAGSGRTVSTFSTDISLGEHLSRQLSEQSSNEKVLMESDGIEMSHAYANASRHAGDLISRISEGQSGGQNYSIEEGSSHAKTLSNVQEFSQNLQKNFGLSQSEAAQVAVGISSERLSIPIPILNKLGIDAKADMNSQAGRQLVLSNLQDFANRNNYNESFDDIQRSLKSINYNAHQGNEKSLSEQMSSSYEKAESFRNSYNAHMQKADRLSAVASMLSSSSLDIRTIENQAFLNYVANLPGTSGDSRIGYDSAAKIIDSTQGPLAERKTEYLQDFKQAQVAAATEYFSSHEMKSAADLTNAFTHINGSMQNVRPSDNVAQFKQSHDLEVSGPDPTIKEQVAGIQSSNQAKISNDVERMRQEGKVMQAKVDDADGNLLLKSGKNLFVRVEDK